MEDFTLSIESLKKKVEELSELQKNGKPGYACGWTDACGIILSLLEKEEIDNGSTRKHKHRDSL